MAIECSRKAGFRVDETTAAQQVKANISMLEMMRDRLYQGFFVPVGDLFGPFIFGYILTGLEAEHYQADMNTDAVAHVLQTHQPPDGSWRSRKATAGRRCARSHRADYSLDARAPAVRAENRQGRLGSNPFRRAAAWLARAQSEEQRRPGVARVGARLGGNGQECDAAGLAGVAGQAAV